MVIEHFIACGVFVVFLYAGDVAQAELVVVVSLNQHLSDVVYGFELDRKSTRLNSSHQD